MPIPFNFDRAIEGLTKVTLKGGMVSKITFAISLVSLALASVGWSANSDVLKGMAMSMIFLLASVGFWKLISFADRHPQAALLEGAEFLVHEQIVHASKSSPTLPASETTPEQPEVIEGPAANIALAELPDEELQPLPDDRGG